MSPAAATSGPLPGDREQVAANKPFERHKPQVFGPGACVVHVQRVGLIGLYSNPDWPERTRTESAEPTPDSDEPITERAAERQKQTRLTPPQIDELIHRRASGSTIEELAHSFGIHRTTVMAHLRRCFGR